MTYLCVVCKETATNRCKKCKLVCYCSDTCQKQHWRKHKPECVLSPSDEELAQCRKFEQSTYTPDPIDIKSLLELDIYNQRTFGNAIEGIHYCILTNNHDDAIQLITKCEETFEFEIRHDILSRFHLAKGLVLIMMNDYLNAMKELQDAIRINPLNASAYINLSMIYFGTSNTNSGLILRKKGRELRTMQSLPASECICGCTSLSTCSRCKLVSYCSKECQIKD